MEHITYECEFCHTAEPARNPRGVQLRPNAWYHLTGPKLKGDFCSMRCLALWAVEMGGK